MKKILFVFALVAGLVSCNEDYTDWGTPQVNSPESAYTIPGMTASASGSIDLATASEDCVIGSLALPTLPEGFKLKRVDVIFNKENGDKADDKTLVSTLGENNSLIVKSADLSEIVVGFYGKRPTERTLVAQVNGIITNGTEGYTVDCGKVLVKATPVAPHISENYYVVGGTLDWPGSAASKEQKFYHSSADVYDDPVFTITIPASATGDTWFAIGDDEACDAITNDGNWSLLLGTANGNGNNGTSGVLKPRYEIGNDGSFMVPNGPKSLRITIDMMDCTYKIEEINFPEFVYEIGNESGWSASHPLYKKNDEGQYQGYYWLDGEYKFKPNADNWDGDWELAEKIDDFSGKLTDAGGPNMTGVAGGFYEINFDLAALSYNVMPVNSISVIGNFNGWGGDADLTYNHDKGCWEGDVNIDQNGFKFRVNHDWAISWGGADGNAANYGNLTQNNGKDLDIPTPGMNHVELYISYEGNNKVVLTPVQ